MNKLSSKKKLLWIIALGNDCRGDDAIGPLLIESLQTAFPCQLIDYSWHYLLCIEDALSLADYDNVLFIDASASCQRPFEIDLLNPGDTTRFTSHSLTPADLLSIFQVYIHPQAQEKPDAWLLAVRGYAFELGHRLSTKAKKNMEQAWSHLNQGLPAYFCLMTLYRLLITNN